MADSGDSDIGRGQTPVGLEQRLARRLRRIEVVGDAALVVGFSGGADSLALASALTSVARERRIVLAHVDHGLRTESAADAEAAAALAAALGLPLRVARIESDPRRLHPGVGLEESARRERYRLLAGVVADEAAAALVLAHHRDDQAETVLLHLLRGAGTAGAAGMAEWSVRPVPWWDEPGAGAASAKAAGRRLAIWRPLLGESREELRGYVTGLELAPIDDPTNDDLTFRRNLVRREFLPALERAWPGAPEALARYAALAAEDDAALAAAAGRALAGATVPDGLIANRVLGEPLAIRRRIVRGWIGSAAPNVEVSAERVEAVLKLLTPGRGGRRVEIGQGWAATARGGIVRLARQDGEGR
jgi:tRNA(Ile)-lysidine synthetase-like protein